MRSFTTKTHIGRCIALCALFIFSMLFAACGSGSSTSDEATPDTGAISFSIVWEDVPSASQSDASMLMAMEQAAIPDCEATGVDTVEAYVYDQNHKLLKRGGPWDCKDRKGTIRGVLAGNNRKIAIVARDTDKNIVYQGEKSGVTVIARAINDVGTITSERFGPVSLGAIPDDGSVIIRWASVPAATTYAIYWSTDPNVSEENYEGMISGIPTTSYTHAGVTNGTTYYYVVIAESEYGKSKVSVSVWTTPTWRVRLFGSANDDYGSGIAVDTTGNCYITGYTDGNLDGHSNAGSVDIVIAKYDADGNKHWSKLLGSSDNDYGRSIAVDADGNCYITGYTDGNLDDRDGYTNAGLSDIMIAKYDTEGNKLWSRLLGSAYDDCGYGIAVDGSGNCYITGSIGGDFDGRHTHMGLNDIVIAKYDTEGNKLWAEFLGSTGEEFGYGIAVDATGNCYITGKTNGDIDGQSNMGSGDIVIAKYDADGSRLWSRLLGSIYDDSGHGIAVDATGNCYITGKTNGDIDGQSNMGSGDIAIAKYDADGSRLWSRLLGSSYDDHGHGIAVDATGNCYITGKTNGDIDGYSNAGAYDTPDIVIAKYDAEGNKRWSWLLGSPGDDVGHGITVDATGNCYITGYTSGDLDDHTNAGYNDIVIAKFDAGEQWVKLLGKALLYHNDGADIAVDANSNAYITGFAFGNLNNNLNAGSYDIVIAKYERDGNLLWSRLLGADGPDLGHSIAVDADGNCYITGETMDDLDDRQDYTNTGLNDIVITKYDTDGNKLWSRLLGSAYDDYGSGIAVDTPGNSYITGYAFGDIHGYTHTASYDTSDIVITKYDTDGNKLWFRFLGSADNDYGYSIAVDNNGNCYITGYTHGNLDDRTDVTKPGLNDIVIAKYDTGGNQLWSRLLGSADEDYGGGIAVDEEGNCYITGYTHGNLDDRGGVTKPGLNDIVIAKYDTDGNQLWSRLLGSADNDYGCGIAVDANRNCYVTGYTFGDLDGHNHMGSYDTSDIVIAKYDTDGNQLWSRLLGSEYDDDGRGIGVDSRFDYYVTGGTKGHLGDDTNVGIKDILIWKLMTQESRG